MKTIWEPRMMRMKTEWVGEATALLSQRVGRNLRLDEGFAGQFRDNGIGDLLGLLWASLEKSTVGAQLLLVGGRSAVSGNQVLGGRRLIRSVSWFMRTLALCCI